MHWYRETLEYMYDIYNIYKLCFISSNLVRGTHIKMKIIITKQTTELGIGKRYQHSLSLNCLHSIYSINC